MRLRSVVVENFGTLSGPVEIEFDEGLNVIYGPNECGKSTLMKAIWFAMTRRAQSLAQDIQEIQPDAGGTPRVELRVSVGQEDYVITKSFAGQRGTAHLRHTDAVGHIQEYKDDEADEVLRGALGFSQTTGRSKTPDHFGLWPLTWVRQGEDHEDPAVGLQERGKDDALAKTLGRITGQVLSGSTGDALLARVEEEYSKFYTPSGSPTTKSGAPLYEASQLMEEAAERRDELQQRRLEYEEDLTRFSWLQDKRNALEVELPGLQEEYEEVEGARREVERIQGQRELVEMSRSAAESERERWEKLLRDRQMLRDRMAKHKKALEAPADKIEEQESALISRETGRPKWVRAREEAEEAAAKADELVEHRRAALELIRLREKLARREKILTKGEAYNARLVEIGGALEAIKVDDDICDQLSALQSKVEAKEIELKAACARVEIKALTPRKITVDGRSYELAPGEMREEQVEAPMSLRVEDLLEVRVHPGNRDLGELRREFDAAKAELSQSLKQCGVTTLSEARKMARRGAELSNELASTRKLLEEVSSEGLASLRQEVSVLQARRESAEEKIMVTGDEAEGQRLLLEAEAELKQAQRGLKDAEGALNEYDRATSELRHRLELARQRRRDAQERFDEADEELQASVEALGSDEEIQQKFAESSQALAGYEAELAELNEELKLLAPQTIDAALERLGRVITNAEKELQDMQEEHAGLRMKLKSVQLHGLHEKIAAAEEALAQAEVDVERWTRKAEATRLLFETLNEAHQEIRQAYLEPLRETVSELLQHLFPESTIRFGEGFEIEGLSRSAKGGDTFERLSFGSREQLGLVVRLAMARLLAGQGSRLPVFFDDVLASSDDARFTTMNNILTLAGRDIQLIITTCHWERFRKLGATNVVDLAARKREKRGAVVATSA